MKPKLTPGQLKILMLRFKCRQCNQYSHWSADQNSDRTLKAGTPSSSNTPIRNADKRLNDSTANETLRFGCAHVTSFDDDTSLKSDTNESQSKPTEDELLAEIDTISCASNHIECDKYAYETKDMSLETDNCQNMNRNVSILFDSLFESCDEDWSAKSDIITIEELDNESLSS